MDPQGDMVCILWRKINLIQTYLTFRIIYLFFHRRPTQKLCFLSCPSQETDGTTRIVENVALTTKGLQERKHKLWVGGRWKN